MRPSHTTPPRRSPSIRGSSKKFWYLCCDAARRDAAHLSASGRTVGLSTRRVSALSARFLSFSRRVSVPCLTSLYTPLGLDVLIHCPRRASRWIAVDVPLGYSMPFSALLHLSIFAFRLSTHILASRRASVPRSTHVSLHLDAPLGPFHGLLFLSTRLSVSRRTSPSLDAPFSRHLDAQLGLSTHICCAS